MRFSSSLKITPTVLNNDIFSSLQKLTNFFIYCGNASGLSLFFKIAGH